MNSNTPNANPSTPANNGQNNGPAQNVNPSTPANNGRNSNAPASSAKSITNYLIPFLFSAAWLFTIITLIFPFIVNPENKKYFEKAPIKATMENTIKNGGDLSLIKHIYDTREIFNLNSLSKNKEKYYAEDYSLTRILNDIKVDCLNSSEPNDSTFLLRLENLIAENNKKHPFDNLEENQQYHFNNILIKLDTTDYKTISPEMINISNELKNKNQLVAKYLNKSEASYIISIAALITSIIIGFIQIFQNYRTSKKLREMESIL